MKKKRVLLISLLLIPSVLAISPESLLDIYLEFYGWFDFMIYLLFFTGISKLAIEAKFKKTGEESKAISLLYISLGLLFSISLVTWEIKSGFYLYQIGPLIAILIGLLILAWIWKLIKSRKRGEKEGTKSSIRYIALFILLLLILIYAIFPGVLNYYFWSSWIEELLTIMGIICLLIILISYAYSGKKEEIIERGESWWDRRRQRKDEKTARKEAKKAAKDEKSIRNLEEKAIEDAKKAEERKRQRKIKEVEVEREENRKKRIKEDEEARKKRIKDVEEHKKREREEAKKARIAAIGKIECFITAYSTSIGELPKDHEVPITDILRFEAGVINNSKNISYVWKIDYKELQRGRTFRISAKEFSKTFSKRVFLHVKDHVTGKSNTASMKINIEKIKKPEIIILAKVQRGGTGSFIHLGTERGIFGPVLEGFLMPEDILKLQLSVIKNEPKRYTRKWTYAGTEKNNADEIIELPMVTFGNKPGRRTITAEITDVRSGKKTKDKIQFILKIEGKKSKEEKAEEFIKKDFSKTKKDAESVIEGVKNLMIGGNIDKTIDSLKEGFEYQEKYLESIKETTKHKLEKGEPFYVDIKEEIKRIIEEEEKNQKDINKIIKILSKKHKKAKEDTKEKIEEIIETLEEIKGQDKKENYIINLSNWIEERLDPEIKDAEGVKKELPNTIQFTKNRIKAINQIEKALKS